jgi:hypothetical protein
MISSHPLLTKAHGEILKERESEAKLGRARDAREKSERVRIIDDIFTHLSDKLSEGEERPRFKKESHC